MSFATVILGLLCTTFTMMLLGWSLNALEAASGHQRSGVVMRREGSER